MSIHLTGMEKRKEEAEAELVLSMKKPSSSELFALQDSMAGALAARDAQPVKKRNLEDPLTKKEKEVFLEIFRRLAQTSLVNLVFAKGEIDLLSKEVEDASPLNFLLFLRSEKSLQDYIKALKISSERSFYFVSGVFPYSRTIQDFSLKMEKEKKGNEVKKFLETPSKDMQQKIEPMIQENRFKDLFELFLEN